MPLLTGLIFLTAFSPFKTLYCNPTGNTALLQVINTVCISYVFVFYRELGSGSENSLVVSVITVVCLSKI
jgi:hypothetical protein